MDFHTSDSIQEIGTALAKAQGEMENLEKSGKNPAFKNEGGARPYSTLSNVLDEVRPKLSKHGIAILQVPANGDDGAVGIVTRLIHCSGEWMEGSLYVKPAQFTAQGVGSVLTYLRRYTLMAMAGVAPDDDDGNAASIEQPANRAPENRAAPLSQRSATKPNGTSAPHSDHPRRAEALQAYKKLSAALDRIGTTPQTIEFLDKYGHAVFPDLDLIGEVNPDTHANLKKRFAGLGIDIDAERARLRQREPGDEAFATEAEAARAALQ